MSQDTPYAGWINGLLGVMIFSGSLPATRLAVTQFDPLFLTFARACIAGALALCLLLLFKQRRPTRSQLVSLAVVAAGVVVGFPLLTALALRSVTAAHAIVFIGLLPLATAAFGVLRGGERPKPAFWVFSALGSGAVAGFAVTQGLAASAAGDLLMLLAILACGMGYAEGAKLAQALGGWQVICWALLLSLPLMLGASLAWLPSDFSNVSATGWASLGYVSVFSMLVGFVFWYRGLAQGGVAVVGQLQLLQPFFGLALAAAVLHEQVSPAMASIAGVVILCILGARRFGR